MGRRRACCEIPAGTIAPTSNVPRSELSWTVLREGLPRWVHRDLPPPPLRCAPRALRSGGGSLLWTAWTIRNDEARVGHQTTRRQKTTDSDRHRQTPPRPRSALRARPHHIASPRPRPRSSVGSSGAEQTHRVLAMQAAHGGKLVQESSDVGRAAGVVSTGSSSAIGANPSSVLAAPQSQHDPHAVLGRRQFPHVPGQTALVHGLHVIAHRDAASTGRGRRHRRSVGPVDSGTTTVRRTRFKASAVRTTAAPAGKAG